MEPTTAVHQAYQLTSHQSSHFDHLFDSINANSHAQGTTSFAHAHFGGPERLE
jgi:hypothetical protein